MNLFVYGTLLEEAESDPEHQAGQISGFKMFDIGAFPGVVRTKDPTDKVVGVMFPVSAENLEAFDHYEGYHEDDHDISLYLREEIDVTVPGGRTERAWVYIFNQDTTNLEVIPTGSWRERGLVKL